MSVVGRLLVLLAVLLMPLGMEPAAASEPSINHHATIAGTATKHCPGQSTNHGHIDGLAMCSMACASALPAQELVRDEAPLQGHQLVMPVKADTLRGIHPDIATPPPKRA